MSPLSKQDAPSNRRVPNPSQEETNLAENDKEANAAVNKVIDSGAGAPPQQRKAAEALPERNPVQKAIKEGMLADDAGTEAKAKAKVVELSPDSPETPSGAALLETADIADDQERGEEYSRIKSAVRHGYVPASAADFKKSKK